MYPDEKDNVADEKDLAAKARIKQVTKKPYFKEQLGPDPFERELLVMAKMKAYYQYVATWYVKLVISMIQKDLLDDLNRVNLITLT